VHRITIYISNQLDVTFSKFFSFHFCKSTCIGPVAYLSGGGVSTPPQNSDVLPKLSRIPISVEYTSGTTWSESGFHSFANWVEPLTMELPFPDPHSLCPLSSTEFVEPPTKKIPGVNHPPPPQKKIPSYASVSRVLCPSSGVSLLHW
jgi:hypothetical protein